MTRSGGRVTHAGSLHAARHRARLPLHVPSIRPTDASKLSRIPVDICPGLGPARLVSTICTLRRRIPTVWERAQPNRCFSWLDDSTGAGS